MDIKFHTEGRLEFEVAVSQHEAQTTVWLLNRAATLRIANLGTYCHPLTDNGGSVEVGWVNFEPDEAEYESYVEWEANIKLLGSQLVFAEVTR